MKYIIQPFIDEDRELVLELLQRSWGSNRVIAHGSVYFVDRLPGFKAVFTDDLKDKYDKVLIGLITYKIDTDACEIVTLDSLVPGIGIGTALVCHVERIAKSVGCRRLWLITTNDNTNGLKFYQKCGFRMVAVYPDAVENSRQLKPEIPLVGNDGIPIRDEIELEKLLD